MTELDSRKRKILQAIVQDYIATAEPVGSRTIARKYNLGVSPATVRNEMADLEEMGLLEQPHTSAGRIPSDQGYRYYVDCLMEKHQLADEERDYIRQKYTQKVKEIEEVIQRTSQLLSDLTNYTSLILAPHLGKSSIHQIQLISILPGKALVVIVTTAGVVENQILDVPESITPRDLERISAVFNEKLRGKALNEIKKLSLRELYSDLAKQKHVLNLVLELLEEILLMEKEEKVYLGGTLNIFEQPEFKNVERLKNLLKNLEEENILRSLLLETSKSGLTITIGGENRYEGFRDCSVITATYEVNNEVVGTIGILGPTRMEYSKAVAIVEIIAEHLSEALTRFYR
ncbi:heat-inducible transcriptional repressor HrcA [Calderihabitans maritimus]|uniref:Heat-inducible transcription repressor HrcA n=1 Tax=Calderihabitans maritimus TaxID=1246530 RepID=A0A1Z5HVB5_9FIRM|nr:heat-inducible transcriptional repressor HrcA [Calderihabitans maritimus]GAW93454.1 heat-inducible transcription repressor HrcA [Calderihabitans maritimus]